MLVAFAAVELVTDTAVAVFVTYSPMLPAFALSFVVVPTIPAVLEGVIVLDAASVVKAPVLADVLPIGPGDAKRAVNPVPLTVELAESVVNAPVFAAVPPIAGGEARYVEKPVPLTVELAERVVKLPALAAVPPIAGGEARYVEKPVPLTVELAANVVKLPVFGVVAPTVPFTAPPVEVSVVKAPAAGVVCPIGVPSTVPPVIATLFAF
jgi:hypothetical protein